MAIWYILWPFGTFCGSFGTFRGPFGTFCGHLVGTFCGHLVHIFPRFGMLYRQKSGNPASGPRGPPRFKSGEKKRLLLRGEKRRQLFFFFFFSFASPPSQFSGKRHAHDTGDGVQSDVERGRDNSR
jgi:hypothetical protein